MCIAFMFLFYFLRIFNSASHLIHETNNKSAKKEKKKQHSGATGSSIQQLSTQT